MMPEQRSTLNVLDEIRQVESGHSVPVLTGNTTDLYVARTGAVVSMSHLLAYEGAEQGYATVMFSLARGSHELTLGGRAPSTGLRHVPNDDGASTALADLLAQLESTTQPVLLIVDYSDLLLPATGGTDSVLREQERLIELLAEHALAQASRRTQHRLVVLSSAGGALDPRLAQLPGFQTVTVGLPNLPERRAMLERLMNPSVGTPWSSPMTWTSRRRRRLLAVWSTSTSCTPATYARPLARRWAAPGSKPGSPQPLPGWLGTR